MSIIILRIDRAPSTGRRRNSLPAMFVAAGLSLVLMPVGVRAEDDVFQPPSQLDDKPAEASEPLSIVRPARAPAEPSRSLQPRPRKVRVVSADARPDAAPDGAMKDRSAFFRPESGPANSRAADAIIAARETLAAKSAVAEKSAPRAAILAVTTPEIRPPEPLPAVREFCANIADMARERRVAFQAERLRELEEQLTQRIGELDQRRIEVKQWLDRQKEAEKKADESVIAIFSRMRPEAAAAQLSAADEATAAAVLAKLNPRTASAILNEIDAAKAAKLTDAISKTRTAQLQSQSASQ